MTGKITTVVVLIGLFGLLLTAGYLRDNFKQAVFTNSLSEQREAFYKRYPPRTDAEHFDRQYGGKKETAYGLVVPWSARDLPDGRFSYQTADGSIWLVSRLDDDFEVTLFRENWYEDD